MFSNVLLKVLLFSVLKSGTCCVKHTKLPIAQRSESNKTVIQSDVTTGLLRCSKRAPINIKLSPNNLR